MISGRGGVRTILLISLLSGLFPSLPSRAQQVDSEDKLEDLEKALQREERQSEDLRLKSDQLRRELEEIAHKLVTAAKTVQDHERKISDLEQQITDLKREEVEKVAKLAAQREQFARVLMSLERLARFPPEAMIAQPTSPSDTVRSAILLRSVVPEIERRAERLRQQIESLAKSRERLNEQQFALRRNTAALAVESQTLGGLLARNKLLKKQTDADHKKAVKRVEKLAREAQTIRDLIASLREEQKSREIEKAKAQQAQKEQSASSEAGQIAQITPPPPKPPGGLTGAPISTRKGQLPFPVVGKIVGRYGENNENGMTRRGVEVTTRPAAQVISPYEGKVVFVGEFRGYGQLLIIEHSEGYHSLLAGMSRIDSTMGQWVLVGEPVGIMDPTTNSEPVLYVELRQDGRPINPLSWLSSRSDSTQG